MPGTDVKQLLLQVDASVALAQRNLGALRQTVDRETAAINDNLGRPEEALARLGAAFRNVDQVVVASANQQRAFGTVLDRVTAQELQAAQAIGAMARAVNGLSAPVQIATREQLEAAAAIGNFARQMNTLPGVHGRVATATNAQRAGMQQLGFQFQDLAVQVGGGTTFMRAFGQQLPQATGAIALMAKEGSGLAKFMMGWPGVLLAIGAALLPMIANLFEAAKSVDDLTAELQKKARQEELNRQAQEAFKYSLEGVTAAIREQDEAQRKAIQTAEQKRQQDLVNADAQLILLRATRQATIAMIQQERVRVQRAQDAIDTPDPNRGQDGGLLPEGLVQTNSQRRLAQLDQQERDQRAGIVMGEANVRGARAAIITNDVAVAHDRAAYSTREHDRAVAGLTQSYREGLTSETAFRRALDAETVRYQREQDGIRASNRHGRRGRSGGSHRETVSERALKQVQDAMREMQALSAMRQRVIQQFAGTEEGGVQDTAAWRLIPDALQEEQKLLPLVNAGMRATGAERARITALTRDYREELRKAREEEGRLAGIVAAGSAEHDLDNLRRLRQFAGNPDGLADEQIRQRAAAQANAGHYDLDSRNRYIGTQLAIGAEERDQQRLAGLQQELTNRGQSLQMLQAEAGMMSLTNRERESRLRMLQVGLDLEARYPGQYNAQREAIMDLARQEEALRAQMDRPLAIYQRELADATGDMGRSLEQLGVDTMKSFADETGRAAANMLGLHGALGDVAAQLVKMALNQAIMQLLKTFSGSGASGAGGGLFGGGGTAANGGSIEGWIGDLIGGSGSFGGGPNADGSISFRANGGPVDPNKPYIVGEKRAELFVPRTAGTIIPQVPKFSVPAAAAMRGGDTHYHIQIDAKDAVLANTVRGWVAEGIEIASQAGATGGQNAVYRRASRTLG